MKVAYKRGYDWIWMMDDDAIPENDTLEKLLLAVGDSSDVIARPALTNNPNQFTPWFAGGIFSRSVISRIGLPWRELFIHWDDVEYAMRAEKNGIKIVNVKDTKIYHKDWTLRGRLSKRVLGKTLSIPLHPKGRNIIIFNEINFMYL
ncbi:MAG: hypothetical protein ABIM18_08315 [candidate division WOR-3 bacterium]